MSHVLLDVSMSLDGYIAGPHVRGGQPMGEEGERLHAWMFNGETDQTGERASASEIDAGVQRELVEGIGAMVIGYRTFDVGIGPWGGTPFPVPCFVPSRAARPDMAAGGGTFAFVTDGIEAALDRASEAAGHRAVCVMGAATAQQCLAAGRLDEIQIHLVPILLGGGTRLFDRLDHHLKLGQAEVIESPYVTHLRYRILT